jgi:hypothetical protein
MAGIIGAQYFLTLGWWHEQYDGMLREIQSAYTTSVIQAKKVVQAVPTGSDAEIRAYILEQADDEGVKVDPTLVTDDDVKGFRDRQLPEFKQLASGQLTQDQYDEKYGLNDVAAQMEKNSEAGTYQSFFLLFFWRASNLFALVAAGALAFKLSTNA